MSCPNTIPCSCPNTTCKNHGRCCECVKSHADRDQLTFCLFPDNNGDKSLKNFYEKLKTRFDA